MRLLRLLPGRGGGLVLALLQGVRAVMPALTAVAVGRLVTALFQDGGVRAAAEAAIVVAGLVLVDQVAWLMITPVRTLVVKRIDGGLRARMRELALGLPGLDVLERGDVQDRLARAVDPGMGIARERSAGNAAVGQLELVFRVISAVAAAAVLATFSVVLAVVLLAAALGMRAVLRRQWMRIIDKLDADTAGQRYEYYVASQAVMGAAKDVRLYGLSDWFAGRFRAAAVRTYGPVWREMLGVLRRQWAIVGGSLLMGAAVLAAPAVAVLDGRLEPGRLITYVLAGFGVLAISAMGMEAYDIEYGLRGLADADALVEAYGNKQARPGSEPAAEAPGVTLENVVFRYPGAVAPVLDGLTLTIAPGEVVAVVGENGAGKTTLVKLLTGLYRPESGHIAVGGVEPGVRRPAATVLFQDFVRYPASLRENVTGGAGGDDADVREALRQAGGDELPADLDTLLWREGEAGTDLSGGQWQRVALARALYAVGTGRRLLVLDEPTANLDVRAEASFHERVVAQVRDTTTILISHRLSTVRFADRIVVLHDGQVAEDGDHDALMALGGRYAEFFTTQAEAFRA
ncbi:ATP-binding cassette domain-containing protein [Paractinoplanes globisporus]|uniref:ATP-binding cassette domain-containing protein n=1 Tax=Paractinoplanes globisporus TaxID=113565 RepID=A0ABW6WSN7_9ACTN|nr:ATP-binding cassette domain-containing protein [Actinoplanes globisporus]